MLVAQSYLTLCGPIDWGPPGSSSVRGILQARMLEWWPVPSPEDLPNPGTEPRLSHPWSPATQFSGFKYIHLVQLSSPPISTTFVIFHYGLLQDIEDSSQPIPPPLPSPLATTSAHYFLWQEIANSSGYISNIMIQSSLKQGRNGPFSKEISSLKCNW